MEELYQLRMEEHELSMRQMVEEIHRGQLNIGQAAVKFEVTRQTVKHWLNKLEGEVRISYDGLPLSVSNFIEKNIDSITSSSKDMFYSTDPSTEFTYGRGGIADSWIEEVNSNYHHFFIEGVHYRLRGNKGHPFILHDNPLYFCDLNLYKDDYADRPYFKVKIPRV